MFICKKCGSKVSVGQAHCSKCGADVVENYQAVCPSCGKKNQAGSRFCSDCGVLLEILKKPVCEACGTKNFPNSKYCASCGAPIMPQKETHKEKDFHELMSTKQRLDQMERDRLVAIDKKIGQKKQNIDDYKESSIKDIESHRKNVDLELEKKAELVNQYREKVNELGAEDLKLLRKMSSALDDYAKYYADPYSAVSEVGLKNYFVCPICGTINSPECTKCSHCGRDKARSLELLEKGKIVQSKALKRKKKIIEAPNEDLKFEKTQSFEDFSEKEMEKFRAENNITKKETDNLQNANTQSTSGGECSVSDGGEFVNFTYTQNQENGETYHMPPIVQPVAFVPYVTQNQPLDLNEQ